MSTFMRDEKRQERAGKRAWASLFRDYLSPDMADVPPEQFSAEEKAHAEVAQGYLALGSIQHSLNQCQYYFRRYPFSRLPLARSDHLRNVCEMYFDRIVQFRDRLKATLNAVKKVAPDDIVPVGPTLKAFDRHFKWEIRQRNHVHHKGRYDDAILTQLGMAELLESPLKERFGDLIDARRIYRRAAREWAERARIRSEHVSQYLELVAKLTLESCGFLAPHIKPEDAKRMA